MSCGVVYSIKYACDPHLTLINPPSLVPRQASVIHDSQYTLTSGTEHLLHQMNTKDAVLTDTKGCQSCRLLPWSPSFPASTSVENQATGSGLPLPQALGSPGSDSQGAFSVPIQTHTNVCCALTHSGFQSLSHQQCSSISAPVQQMQSREQSPTEPSYWRFQTDSKVGSIFKNIINFSKPRPLKTYTLTLTLIA